MTFLTQTPSAPVRPALNVVGPYSPWPRKRSRKAGKPILYAGFAFAAAIVAHCGVPLLV